MRDYSLLAIHVIPTTYENRWVVVMDYFYDEDMIYADIEHHECKEYQRELCVPVKSKDLAEELCQYYETLAGQNKLTSRAEHCLETELN